MKKTICFLTLFLTVCSVNAFAQFQGRITYNLYEINDHGEREGEEHFTAYFTPQRIFIQGDETVEMPGPIKAEGLLIRLDKKDFVFLTGDETAFSITKAGITSFMNMFGEMGEDGRPGQDEPIQKSFTFQKAGATKTINGFTVHKFIAKDKSDPNNKGIVWMTREVNINWGMLAEPWGNVTAFLTDEELPTELILQKGWLPIKATFYENGNAEGGFAATVEKTDLAQKKVQLSSEITVKNLAQYLFQQMRQQQ